MRWVFITFIAIALLPAEASAGVQEDYQRYCALCHGNKGDGNGPASPWLWPTPRNFLATPFKWKTTNTNSPPTLTDVENSIRFGAKGTSMPPFAGILSDQQINQLATYIFRLAKTKPARKSVPLQPPSAKQFELVAQGKKLYGQLGCGACHGTDGQGGPAGNVLTDSLGRSAPPFPWSKVGPRRPYLPSNKTSNRWKAIARSIQTGIPGTAMAGFGETLSNNDLWALAAFVDTLFTGNAVQPNSQTPWDKTKGKSPVGYSQNLPIREHKVWGSPIPLASSSSNGKLAPAQKSLSVQQCGRCHAAQKRQWKTSIHSKAGSPGLIAQLIDMNKNGKHTAAQSCQRCHGPLPEQLPFLKGAKNNSFEKNESFDAGLRREGINCAGCHVRGGVRFGPPKLPGGTLLAAPAYPKQELTYYERAEFCAPCHQLPQRLAVNGKPLLNTFVEWAQGPYMPRGIQCQHCHMPNREHTWKGVHDPETFREGIRVETKTRWNPKTKILSVRVRMFNHGAGHYLPTTPTPAAWLTAQLLDANGNAIPGGTIQKRIGRHIEYKNGAWVEHEDTRIPPGEYAELSTGFKGPGTQQANAIQVQVKVEPDEYYQRFYESNLRRTLSPKVRQLFEQALQQTKASHYVAFTEVTKL